MTWPNKYVLLNYTVRAFLLSAITATRSAHHNIDTLRAVGKSDKRYEAPVFVQLSILLVCPNIYI
jgi:hypothetical protein